MLLFLLLLSCTGPPTEALGWREAWELLIMTSDGGVIEAQAVVGNTGLLRGQGHLRINRWTPGETPIQFQMSGGPADVDIDTTHKAVRVGSALMGQYELGENWTLRVASEQANAILHVDPGGPVPPMATTMGEDGQWSMTAPITRGPAHGWVTAGKRGGMVNGWAIALHRGGDGIPPVPRQAVFVISPRVSVGLDDQGETRLGWARIDDTDIPLTDLQFQRSSDGGGILDFRPAADLRIALEATGVGGIQDGFSHLYLPERWVARAAGFRATRTVTRAAATVQWQEERFQSAAMVLRGESLTLPRTR
jgi:hypothetical protein